MPYQGYPDGVYLGTQSSRKGGFAHYLVLDIGNRLQVPAADGINPVAVHQCPPRIRADWFRDVGDCLLLAVASDEKAARLRYEAALTSPDYYLFRHNCEQFARFVVTGTWESKQLQALGWLAGITALAVVAGGNDAPPRRTRASSPSRGDWRYASRRRSYADRRHGVRSRGEQRSDN